MHKGQLEGFPSEIVKKMLDYQVEQGNPRNIAVFKQNKKTPIGVSGFDWNTTKEGYAFWNEVIIKRNFTHFFNLYPRNKQEIIGYKLKPEFRYLNEVCRKITGFNYTFITGYDDRNRDYVVSSCHIHSKLPTVCYDKLSATQVLNLWFEPIYKENEKKEEPSAANKTKDRLEEIQLQITNLLKTL